jgi:hypothetical protein
MNSRAIQVFIGFVLLVGLTAGLLVRVRANYVLGTPGVKLENTPMYNEEGNVVSDTRVFLPETIGDYHSKRVEMVSKMEQIMLPPDTVYGRRIYKAPDGFEALISVVLMGTDRTSIHKPQYCLTGQGERIVKSEVISIPIESPMRYDLKVMKLTTESQVHVGGGRFAPLSGIFLYWFVADGQLTPHHGERMWLMGRDLVMKGLLQRWAYIAYYARCNPGQENALLERMKSFVAQSVPEFQVTAAAERTAQSARSDQLASN